MDFSLTYDDTIKFDLNFGSPIDLDVARRVTFLPSRQFFV